MPTGEGGPLVIPRFQAYVPVPVMVPLTTTQPKGKQVYVRRSRASKQERTHEGKASLFNSSGTNYAENHTLSPTVLSLNGGGKGLVF